MSDYQSTFSMPGVASGIDWGAMADKIIENARKPQQQWVQRRDTLELKIGLFEELSANMRTMRRAVTPMKLASTFTAKMAEFTLISGASANSVVTAEVDPTASISRHNITVTQKAVAETRFSNQIVGQVGAAGTFSINVGGRRGEITVTATDTLTSIAQKINSAKDATIDPATGEATGEGIGVTASVLDNRIILKSTNTGVGAISSSFEVTRGSGTKDNMGFTFSEEDPSSGNITEILHEDGTTTYTRGTHFTVESGSDEITWINGHGPAEGEKYTISYTVNSNPFSFTENGGILTALGWDGEPVYVGENSNAIEATDAVINVDGLTVTRSSNEIDDLIEGVKLTVNGPGEVIMDISQNAERAVKGVHEFVEYFNDVMDWINIRLSESRQEDAQDDFSKKFGLLHGNSLLWQSKSQLRMMMTSPVTTQFSEKKGRAVFGTMGAEGLAQDSSFKITVGARTSTIEVKTTDTLQDIRQKINSAYELTHDAQGRVYPRPLASATIVDNQLVIRNSPGRTFSLEGADNTLDVLGIGTPLSLLSQIGVSTESVDFGKSGKLEFDPDKLMEAMRDDPEHVAALMNTIMTQMDNYIGNMVDAAPVEIGKGTAPRGRIASQVQSFRSEIDTINRRITSHERGLQVRARTLFRSFSQAEVRLAKMQEQSMWLASVVSQLGGFAGGQ